MPAIIMHNVISINNVFPITNPNCYRQALLIVLMRVLMYKAHVRAFNYIEFGQVFCLSL